MKDWRSLRDEKDEGRCWRLKAACTRVTVISSRWEEVLSVGPSGPPSSSRGPGRRCDASQVRGEESTAKATAVTPSPCVLLYNHKRLKSSSVNNNHEHSNMEMETRAPLPSRNPLRHSALIDIRTTPPHPPSCLMCYSCSSILFGVFTCREEGGREGPCSTPDYTTVTIVCTPQSTKFWNKEVGVCEWGGGWWGPSHYQVIQSTSGHYFPSKHNINMSREAVKSNAG